MPLIRPIQPSFGGGEYAPELYSRVDIQKYSSGLRKCRNFIVHPSGGVSNRTGTRFVARAKYSDKKCIVQEFIFSNDQKYIFEFGDKYVRFYTQESQLNVSPDDYISWSNATAYVIGDYVTLPVSTVYYAIQASTNKNPASEPTYWAEQTIYEVPTPYEEADLALLRFESSADVVFITSPDFQTRTLTRFGATDFRLELYEPDDGPFMVENLDDSISLSVAAVTGNTVLTSTEDLFVSGHVGALFKLRHYVEGQAIST